MLDVEPVVVDEVALAAELGGEPAEPPKDAPPPKTPPDGDGTPKTPDTTKDAQPPKEEKKDEEGKIDGELPPDPLVEFSKDPEKALQGLLAHPTLGPILDRWANKTIEAKVGAATKGAEDTAKAAEDQAQIEKEDKFFDGLTQEQLTEELANPETGKDASAAYGRYNLRKEQRANAPAPPTPEQLDFDVQVASIRSLVETYRQMVDASELSDEVKETLQPGKFTQYGKQALVKLGEAVYTALVEHGVSQAKESAIEEARAELDPERKGAGGGRPPGSMPDLMKTPSDVGLKQALEEEAHKRK